MGRFLPPDHSAGDETTLGGYMAVHSRPAAFDGPNGVAYTVDVIVDTIDDATTPFAAYVIFLEWRRIGEPGIDAHLETAYVAFGATEREARDEVGAMPLARVKEMLDEVVTQRRATDRKWWNAMRDDDANPQ